MASTVESTTFGSGSDAKNPRRGSLATTPAAKSLTRRARSAALPSSPKCTPGDETDRIALSMPQPSIIARCSPTDQDGHFGMPSGNAMPDAMASRS
ncbi:hypothetical protein [Rhodococcus sp. IEGM 1370]|uniref:hypothetical protein n=1 Tax=Rhodococcus sp. IEGM 1370 TaxID=3082222 RepID=UPI0039881D14